jgi:integrase
VRGHLEKRYKSTWTIIIDVGHNPVTKKRDRIIRSVKGPKRAAEKVMNEILYQLQTGTYIEPSNLTVGEYLERWLATHGEQNLRPKTYRSYRMQIHNHLIPTLGSIPLEKLTPMHLQEYYSLKLKKGRKDGTGGLSARTVTYHHRIIREALKHAVQWQLVLRNVADAVVPPRYKKWEMAILSREEALQLLDQIKEHRDYSLIFTAIYTGMRQGELLGLRWSDVDLGLKVLKVNQQLQYIPGQGYVFSPPKTDKSRRQIPMGAALVEIFKEHKREQAQNKLLLGQDYEDMNLVFCLSNGKPIDRSNLNLRFKRIIKQFGRPEIRFHDLRHTCATLFMAAGVDAKKVQEILGHESIRTTLDIYGHVLPSMQREAVDRMNDFMGR